MVMGTKFVKDSCLEQKMKVFAENYEYEKCAILRDFIKDVKEGKPAVGVMEDKMKVFAENHEFEKCSMIRDLVKDVKGF